MNPAICVSKGGNRGHSTLSCCRRSILQQQCFSHLAHRACFSNGKCHGLCRLVTIAILRADKEPIRVIRMDRRKSVVICCPPYPHCKADHVVVENWAPHEGCKSWTRLPCPLHTWRSQLLWPSPWPWQKADQMCMGMVQEAREEREEGERVGEKEGCNCKCCCRNQ
jgi:hypothetical protein